MRIFYEIQGGISGFRVSIKAEESFSVKEVILEMGKNEERIRRVHQRAAGLQRERDRRILLTSGGMSSVLLVLLLVLTADLQRLPEGVTEGFFGASSLLSEGAGGYVMVAVLAFMLGTAVTIMLTRYRKMKRNIRDTNCDKEKNGEDD